MQSGSLLLPPLPKTRRTKPRISHEMHQQPPSSRIDHLPPPPPPPPPPQFATSPENTAAASSLRELLIECAAAVSSSDWHRAIHLLLLLRRSAHPDGDSDERLACYLSTALARCIYSLAPAYDPSIHSLLYSHNLLFTPDVLHMHGYSNPSHPLDSSSASVDEEYSAYRALNQVTPFIRFSHLSANQAILEAVDREKAVHIVDLEIMQGLQWPPFMQALVERRRLKQLEAEELHQEEEAYEEEDLTSLALRITGTGPSMELLEQTGSRLRDFARTLGLEFEFNPICSASSSSCTAAKDDVDASFRSLHEQLELRPGEALVVNCMTQLHRLLPAARRAALPRALQFIRSLSPRIVTVAEKEVEHDCVSQGFMERFMAALEYYGAVFDSLEATLAPRNPQRLMIERLVLAKEVSGLVLEDSGEEEESTSASSSSSSTRGGEKQTVVRYQSFTRWRQAIEGAGFSVVQPSDFSIAQARLLLRLHYPADGYRLVFENEQGCLFLSWHNKPLVALSAWSC